MGYDQIDLSENFVEVGRKEMFDPKARLKSPIFQPKPVDTTALISYLSDLFSGDDAAMALKVVRGKIESFCEELQREPLSDTDVRHVINGILASPLMSEEACTTLREFADNAIVLTEVASVLNMRLGSLGTWTYPVTIEMRRHLNGKYRAFTDPEILDAIFLQHIGVVWQIKFKEVFREIFCSKARKRSFPPLTTLELQDRQLYFEERKISSEIEDLRNDTQERLFLCQLASDASTVGSYDDPSGAKKGGDTSTTKELMRVITTEAYLNATIYGTHAIIHSDIEWFGPSLSHDAILTVLSFVGVSEQWCEFLQTFLRTPLRFKEDPANESRTRQCGTPFSYSISIAMGEAILFCMDFAVNQKADGLVLFRIHDDLRLWDYSHERVATGWREMNRYAQRLVSRSIPP